MAWQDDDERANGRANGWHAGTATRSAPHTATEKPLPQNVEAEGGVLGSLLIDPEAIERVAAFLRAEDFWRESHRTIFQAARDLYETGGPADVITLTDELARRGKLEEIGGVSYVTSLANQVPTSRNVVRYAQIVERTAVLRRLIHAAGQIAGVAYNEPDADDAIAQAEQLIADVAGGRASTHHTARAIGAGMSALLDRLEALQDGTAALRGVPTGFRPLDKLLGGGLQRSDLAILAARPAVGKSSVALSIADEAMARGQRVALFSLEMSYEQVLERVLAMRAHVDLLALRAGALDDRDWSAVSEAAAVIDGLPMVVDDTPGLTVADLTARAKRLMRERPYDLLIVDYLQLMAGGGGTNGNGGSGRSENRQQEVSGISRGLKALARTLDVPVLALSQLSRAVEGRADKTPILSDLRESGSIEQDADVVLFIHREEVYNPDTERKHIADIHLAKQRQGPTGKVSLFFQASETRYRDLELRTPDGGHYGGATGDLPYSDD